MSDIGEMASVKPVCHLRQAMQDYIYAPVLACDLDGTIRYNKNDPDGYIDGPESIAIYEGVEDTLWDYRRRGYVIAGISNQGGVAYDFKTPEQEEREIYATFSQFDRNPFFHIQSCYSHPEGNTSPFDRRSLKRKPNIGMLAILEEDLQKENYLVNWDESIVVGDMESDKEMAERADVEFRWSNEFFNTQ